MKKTIAFVVALTIMLSGVCLAWENNTTITLYSGPGYEYSTELGTLQKDWYVEVISLALDSKDNYWAHIKFANYSDRFYMAYTPLSTINIDGSSVVGLDVEGNGVEDLVASYDVDVYYGPHNPNIWENQYAKCPERLTMGSWAELISSYGNYYLVEFYGYDGLKHRGYVQKSALKDKTMPADYYDSQSGNNQGYASGNSYGSSNGGSYGSSNSSSYGSSYGSGAKASYMNGIYQEYVYESSHLTNQWGDYRVERAFDNNANTDWVEGSKGKQLNDYVGCVWRTNDSSIVARGITIKGGMQYLGYTSWNRNQRPKNITVTINGRTYYFTMSDNMGEQTFYFNGDYIRPDSNGRLDLRVTITSVYRLTNEEGKSVSEYDVAINDIDLLCANAR